MTSLNYVILRIDRLGYNTYLRVVFTIIPKTKNKQKTKLNNKQQQKRMTELNKTLLFPLIGKGEEGDLEVGGRGKKKKSKKQDKVGKEDPGESPVINGDVDSILCEIYTFYSMKGFRNILISKLLNLLYDL